jgi:hypothetical protein
MQISQLIAAYTATCNVDSPVYVILVDLSNLYRLAQRAFDCDDDRFR